MTSPVNIERQAYKALRQGHLTLAAAARQISVSRQTLYKWVKAGAAHVVLIGPPGFELKRMTPAEVERLKRESVQSVQT